jgi:hypothetical protein
MSRRFPTPWREEKISGGYVVRDANRQTLVHIFARSSESEAIQAKMLTMDEARRIAVNVAKRLLENYRNDPESIEHRAASGKRRKTRAGCPVKVRPFCASKQQKSPQFH